VLSTQSHSPYDNGDAWTGQNALLTPPPPGPSWLLGIYGTYHHYGPCLITIQLHLIHAHSACTALGCHWQMPHEANVPPSNHPYCCMIDAINAVPLWYCQWLSLAFNTRSCWWQWYPFLVSFLQHFLLLTSVNLAYNRSNSLYLDTSIELNTVLFWPTLQPWWYMTNFDQLFMPSKTVRWCDMWQQLFS